MSAATETRKPYVGLAVSFAEVLVILRALERYGNGGVPVEGRVRVRRKPVNRATALRGFESGWGWYIEEVSG